jgi:hypothetical protein
MMPSRGDNPSPPPNEPVAISGQISRPAKPPSGNGATLIGIVETTGKPHSARTDVASPDTPAANGTNKQPAHANDLPPGYVELPPPG